MGNATFQELVNVEWAISQPTSAIESLLAGVDRIDAALSRVSTEGASRFSANLQVNLAQAGQAVNLLSAQYERLISLQNQASQGGGGGVLTANRFGEAVTPPSFGTEKMEVFVDENRRRLDREAIMDTPMFQNLKQRVQEMRGGGYGTGGGGEMLMDDDWLTPVAPEAMPRPYSGALAGMGQFSELAGLRSNINIEQSAAAGGLGLGEYERLSKLGEEAFASQEKFGNSVKGVTQAIEAEGRGMNILDNHFVKHAVSVAELIVIYEGFRFAGEAVQGLVNQYVQLESVTARLSYIQGPGDFSQKFRQAADYGIAPTQAGSGLIAGSQLGASSQQQREAEQIALVFGIDQHENALKELVQTQIRADAAGVKNVNTLGYLATAYKTQTGDLETYMDALQGGIELQDSFGLSSEKSALAILKISQGTEMSADAVVNMVERMKKSMEVPANAEALERLGIKQGPTDQMLRQAAALESQFIKSGQTDKAEELAQALSGGLGGVQTLRQMKVALMELNSAFEESNQQLESWDSLQESVSNTTTVNIQKMQAAWGVFVAALSDTAPVQVFFDSLNHYLIETTGILKQLTTLTDIFPQAATSFLQNPVATSGAVIGRAVGAGGYDPSLKQSPFMQGMRPLLDPLGYLENMLGAITGTGEAESESGMGSGRSGGSAFNPIAPPRARGTYEPPKYEFGGFRDLPKGTDWNEFVQNVRGQEAKIKEQVPEYQMDRRTIAFYDQSLGIYRKLVADSEAIRLATEDQNKLLEQITGVFNVPAGGEVLVPFSALQSGFMPSDRYSQMAQAGGSSAPISATRDVTHAAQQSLPMTRTRIPGSGGGTLYDEYDHERPMRHRTRPQSTPSTESDGGPHEQGRSRGDVKVQVYVDGQSVASVLGRTLYRRMPSLARGGFGQLLVN